MQFPRFLAVFVMLLMSFAVQAATPDVAKMISLDEVQRFVAGSALVAKQDKPGNSSKYIYVDKQWPTMPVVSIQVDAPKDAVTELKRTVKVAEGMFGLKLKPMPGVGDEAYYDDQFGTVYFRKGAKVAIIGGKGGGQISVKLADIAKLLASKM